MTILLCLTATVAVVLSPFNPAPPDTIFWHFEELVSYGQSQNHFADEGEELELLKVATNVIMGEDGIFYIIDSGLSQVIQWPGSNGQKFQIYNIGGEGPGLCPLPPRTIIQYGKWFAMLNPIPLRIIFTDLKGEKYPPLTISNPEMILAVALDVTDDSFVVNTVMQLNHEWKYTLSLLDKEGQLQTVFKEEYKDRTENRFPVFFHRNRWTILGNELAVVVDMEGTIQIFSLNGDLKRQIAFPQYLKNKVSVGPDNCIIHGLFSVNEELWTLLRIETEFLQFHVPEKGQLVVIKGVRPSTRAEYHWLNQDHLAVVYGFADKLFGYQGDEEHHMVTIYRRRLP
ncbi:MAG: hypothetical protein PHO91_03520 [Patescibacteria group bacterium]|nr:hypothetical protein [Patescibacteria group bacterium]